MRIETKYSYKQSVWFMHENKPTEKYVIGILIRPIRNGEFPVISYELADYGCDEIADFTLLEKEVYITKAELLKSL